MSLQLPPAASWVRQYIGLPYSEDGCSRGGINCWNLSAMVQQQVFKRPLPYMPGEESSRIRELALKDFVTEIQSLCSVHGWKPTTERVMGHLVLVRGSFQHMHLGVLAAADIVLHVYEDSTSRCQELRELRVLGIYRYG